MNIPKLSGDPKRFTAECSKSASQNTKSTIETQMGASKKYDKISFSKGYENLRESLSENKQAISYENIIQQKAILSKGIDYARNLSEEAAKLSENGGDLSWQAKAENLTKVYTELYDEIVQGYENGTRQIYIIDVNSVSGLRVMTQEEELNAIDAAYEKNARSFEEIAARQQKAQTIIGEWKDQVNAVKEGKAHAQSADALEEKKDKSSESPADKMLSIVENWKSNYALYGRNKAWENILSRFNGLFK